MDFRRHSGRRLGVLIAVASISAAGLTCTDGPVGLGERRLTRLGLAPAFSERAASIYAGLAAFELNVNNVRLRLERGDGNTAADTTVQLLAGEDSVAIAVDVTITGSSEELLAEIELRDGNTVLFSGTQTVIARIGVINPAPPPPVTIEYTGPGAGATALEIAPSDTTIPQSGSVTYRSSASTEGGEPVADFPVVWKVVEENSGSMSGTGVYAPAPGRYTARVVGRMPQGAADTVTVNVVPPATTIALISGAEQTGVVGSALAAPFVVESRAGDGLPSPFTELTVAVVGGGGSVSTTTVTTGADARASVSLTLGNTAGANTVRFSGAGLTPLDVSATGTAATAAALHFTTQPQNTNAGTAFGVVVTARDQHGNTAAYSGDVTVAITEGAGAPGAQLFGTRTVTAANGVATFSGLAIDKTATGYTLTATSEGLTAGTSTPFAIGASPPAVLTFNSQVNDVTAGASFGVSVVVKDTLGNVSNSDTTSVTIALAANPGEATLGGTRTVVTANGLATFTGLTLDNVGEGYTLSATSTGLTGATSNAFNVGAGAAASLAVTNAPESASAGAGFSVTVTAHDGSGNVATGFNGNVTLAIANNPSGGVLSGTATVAAENGVASFAGLSIDKPGEGYTLSASATDLTPGTSGPITIVGSTAIALSFSTQPPLEPPVTAGTAFTVVVTAIGADEAPVPFSGDVSLSITEGTGSEGAQLFGTTTVTAVDGVATFTDLRIDKMGGEYMLTATSEGLGTAHSAVFNVFPSPAAVLEFFPVGNQVAGEPFDVAVIARDTLGNPAIFFDGNITIAIGNNPSGGTLSGTLTVAAVSGLGFAIFQGLTIDNFGNGYTLTASSDGLIGVTSASFNVAENVGAQFSISAPQIVTAGQGFTVTVALKNDNGATVTSFAGNVTLEFYINEFSATLSGTTTVAAVDGVATFTGISIDKVGSGYMLLAFAGDSPYSPGISDDIRVEPGEAASLEFSIQPKSVQPDEKFTVAVRALDALGNVATGFAKQVTIGFDHNPGDATLSGTTVVIAENGVATFPEMSINREGTGYSLKAISEIGVVDSREFNVRPLSEARILFWVDENGGYNVVPDAVSDAGHPLTIATDDQDFVRLLTENTWDLVIYGEQDGDWFRDAVQEQLTQHVSRGGRLLAVTWLNSQLLQLMRATWAEQNYTSFSTTEHAIFTGLPSTVPIVNPQDWWGIFSQGYKPAEASAECLGETPSGNCMAILGNENRTLLLGPLFDTYCEPSFDGEWQIIGCDAVVGTRLVANAVAFLLGQSAPAAMIAGSKIARPSRSTILRPRTRQTQRTLGTDRPRNCKSARCGAP